MPDDQPSNEGQVDLERELTCSICTDLLFQPLTLLDCLHTFCGACLKEWFLSQASNASSIHPYTCPSCRASVRATKHNATVSTLLDSFLRANPTKGRNDEEKEDQKKIFKPGDSVMPRLRRVGGAGEQEEDSRDRRMVEEARQRSLQEVRASPADSTGSSLAESDARRVRDRSREQGSSRERSRNRREPRQVGMYLNSSSRDARGRAGRTSSRRTSPPQQLPASSSRHVEHQSSLRSLLSVSDMDPQDMEAEIMRQIVDEGLLDDIDLRGIDVSQEDELSELIAQAYRRRQEERRREREARDGGERVTPRSPEAPIQRTPDNLSSLHPSSASSSTEVQSQRQLTLNNGSGSAGSRSHSATAAVPAQRNRSASASGSPGRPTTAEASLQTSRTTQRERSQPSSTRRPTDVTNARDRSQHDDSASEVRQPPPRTSSDPSAASSQPRPQPSPRLTSSTFPMERQTSNSISPIAISAQQPSPVVKPPTQPPPPPPPPTSIPRSPGFQEPSISCDRCGKAHIEYEVHYNCDICRNGKYNLCLGCYRLGRGCLYWYGFGMAAFHRYERETSIESYPVSHDPPHILMGHRYLRPPSIASVRPTADETPAVQTSNDPAKRLEAGVFCDICHAFSNDCYWKCDTCNEGAWGFCNSCVNQNRHCTHPLLALKHKFGCKPGGATAVAAAGASPGAAAVASTTDSSPQPTPHSPSQVQPQVSSSPLLMSESMAPLPSTDPTLRSFAPLPFHTACDICRYPIQPSLTRFHCPQCNSGDYDICSSCYGSLVSSGRISVANGHQGWRRCLKGHRMVIVGFEDRVDGQKRIVVQDLVGGVALREEDDEEKKNGAGSSGTSPTASVAAARPGPGATPPQPHHTNTTTSPAPSWSWTDADGTVRQLQHGAAHAGIRGAHHHDPSSLPGRLPPDGGVGLRVRAHWSYYPADGMTDELMFPKDAEIREAEDINGDWFWGVYCGAKGLFPGNYGRIVGRV